MDLILLLTAVVSFGSAVYMVTRKMPLLLAVPENLINESFVIRPPKAKVVWDHIVEWVVEKHYVIWTLFFLEVFLTVFHVVFSSIDGVFFFLFKKVRAKKEKYLSHIESGYWRYPTHWRKAAEKKSEAAESSAIAEELMLVDNIVERQWPLK